MNKLTWRKCRKIFLEAIFSHLRKLNKKVSVQDFCYRFTWYHRLRKFTIAFQQIVIQNYDVYFARVLHFFHRCYTSTALLSANQNRGTVQIKATDWCFHVVKLVGIFHSSTYPAGCTSSRIGMSKARTTLINTLTSLTVRFWREKVG